MLELLEHEQRTGLAHHEAVAPGVERPRRACRVVVAPGERAHRPEARDADLGHSGLGAAAEHHIRAAEPDRVSPVADRHVRGGARRAFGEERPACPELDRDPAGAEVRDDRRDRERADPVRATLAEHVVALLERLEAADPGRHRGADPVSLLLDLELRVGDRLPRRREDQVREAVHPPRRLAVDPVGRVEVLHLAREVDGIVGVVELRDLTGARLAGEQARPGRLDVEPERRHCAQPGDDDASASVERTVRCVHYIPSPPSTSSTSPVMNDASSEQRKRTAPATSFGSPSRPSGVFPSIAAVASSGSTSVSCVRT